MFQRGWNHQPVYIYIHRVFRGQRGKDIDDAVSCDLDAQRIMDDIFGGFLSHGGTPVIIHL